MSKLFEHLRNEHGLRLDDSELRAIERIALKKLGTDQPVCPYCGTINEVKMDYTLESSGHKHCFNCDKVFAYDTRLIFATAEMPRLFP